MSCAHRDRLIQDQLWMPTDGTFKLSATVVVGIIYLGAVTAIRRSPEAVIGLSPLFGGLLVGLVAYRRPAGAVLAAWAIGSAVSIGVLGEDGFAFLLLGVLGVPLASLAAVSSANVRRWLRGRRARNAWVP